MSNTKRQQERERRLLKLQEQGWELARKRWAKAVGR